MYVIIDLSHSLSLFIAEAQETTNNEIPTTEDSKRLLTGTIGRDSEDSDSGSDGSIVIYETSI